MCKDYQLTVLDQNIHQDNKVKFYDEPYSYVMLPVTTVLQALGAQIEWESIDVAKIVFNEEIYLLNTSKKSIIREKDNLECIIAAPGSKVYREVVENELLLDDISFKITMQIMGAPIKIDVDYQKYSITIS